MFKKKEKKKEKEEKKKRASEPSAETPRRPSNPPSVPNSGASTWSGRADRMSPNKASLAATAPPEQNRRRWRPRRKPSSSDVVEGVDADDNDAETLSEDPLQGDPSPGVDSSEWDALLPETPTFGQSVKALDSLLDKALISRGRALDTSTRGDLAQSRLDHAEMYSKINRLPRTKALMYNKLIEIREERDIAVHRVHELEGKNQKLNLLLHIETEKVHKLQASDKEQKQQLRELRKHRREANILLKTTMADYEEHQRASELERQRLAEELTRQAKAREQQLKKEREDQIARHLREKVEQARKHQQELMSHKEAHRNELSSRQSERDREIEKREQEIQKREQEKRELEEKHKKEKEELEKHKIILEKKFISQIKDSKSAFHMEKNALKERLGKARKTLDVARDKHIVAKERALKKKFAQEMEAQKAKFEKELFQRDTFINKQAEYIKKIEEENRELKIEKVKVSLMHLDSEYESVAAALSSPFD